MNYVVLEPDIISISENDWLCEVYRDRYLEHFSSILSYISDDEKLFLAWSVDMEVQIWCTPQLLPWRKDRNWSNTLIPVIYKMMQTNANYVDVFDNIGPCSIVPSIYCYREDLYISFKRILTSLHCSCDKIMIAFGLKNIPPQNHTFKVAGNDLNPSPIFIAGESDFLNQVDVAFRYWPRCPEDSDSIERGISIILKRDYGLDVPLTQYKFSNKFIRKLSNTTNDRIRILNAISKRLSMSTAAAGRDGCLQDENIAGGGGDRRFRVTSSKRIHYKFNSSGIIFLMFYDSGEHDDGL